MKNTIAFAALVIALTAQSALAGETAPSSTLYDLSCVIPLGGGGAGWWEKQQIIIGKPTIMVLSPALIRIEATGESGAALTWVVAPGLCTVTQNNPPKK